MRNVVDHLAHNNAIYHQRLTGTRWVAGAGVLVMTLISTRLLALPLYEVPMLLIGVFVVIYNAALAWMTRTSRLQAHFDPYIRLQIALDWLSMVLFVHFTGGITSPALMLFFLHVIIVTILLPDQSPYLYVAVIVGMVLVMTVLEAEQILPHYNVIPGLPAALHQAGGYVGVQLTFFAIALTASVYITESIMQPLRERERQYALANKALREADKQREQFVHIVTHELRAPVVGAQSLVRVLLGGLSGTLTAQQLDIIQRISRRMDGLLDLINDLLSLAASKVNDFQQPLVPVDVQTALHESLENFVDQAREKSVQLTAEVSEKSPSVLATPDGLKRIFDNLIGNAVKYTPERGMVCVSLTREAEQVVIHVRDSGIGIPADALAQLGQEFYRAPNAREAGFLGTGLGLATVKQLVAKFSGQLDIQSEVGKGSTFTVSLPIVGTKGAVEL